MHHLPDMTLGDLEDLEARQDAGDHLTRSELQKLEDGGRLILCSLIRSINTIISATLSEFSAEFEKVKPYVEAQPPWERRRLAHMTVSEIKREIAWRQVRISSPVSRSRAREHRPTASRRAAASSSTSSSDPGDGDPDPARRALLDDLVRSDWPADLIDLVAYEAWEALR